jgi:uncharacterized protein DUF6285
MHDLPAAPDLLAFARDVLLNDLLPRLPPEARLDARLVASSVAIAEREAMAGDEAAQEIFRGLERFYADAGSACPAAANGGQPDLLARFSRDLRIGPADGSDREALDILWRLTIGKLRRANPRFLAANGFS